MKKNKFLGFALGAVLISGCVADQNDRTAATLIGAGVGAILGQSMSKDKNKGAAVGAMVGMVAGNIYAQALGTRKISQDRLSRFWGSNL